MREPLHIKPISEKDALLTCNAFVETGNIRVAKDYAKDYDKEYGVITAWPRIDEDSAISRANWQH